MLLHNAGTAPEKCGHLQYLRIVSNTQGILCRYLKGGATSRH